MLRHVAALCSDGVAVAVGTVRTHVMALNAQLSVYGFSAERLDAMVRWLNEQGVFRLEDLIGKCLVGMTALVIV